jgi:hypothetical protein
VDQSTVFRFGVSIYHVFKLWIWCMSNETNPILMLAAYYVVWMIDEVHWLCQDVKEDLNPGFALNHAIKDQTDEEYDELTRFAEWNIRGHCTCGHWEKPGEWDRINCELSSWKSELSTFRYIPGKRTSIAKASKKSKNCDENHIHSRCFQQWRRSRRGISQTSTSGTCIDIPRTDG